MPSVLNSSGFLLSMGPSGFKIPQEQVDRQQHDQYQNDEMFDSRDVLPDDLETVASGITGPDHDGDRKERRDSVGYDEFQNRHSHDAGHEEELSPQSKEMSPEEDEKLTPSRKFFFKDRKSLGRQDLPESLARYDHAPVFPAHTVEEEVCQQHSRVHDRQGIDWFYHTL